MLGMAPARELIAVKLTPHLSPMPTKKGRHVGDLVR